jgi:uncharacterized protein
MSGREPAWRIFANELSASLEEERGSGERAAIYLLSPLGARMNRVVVAGTLAPPESIGRDSSQPFYRARLTDPTGTVAVTAGSFQPRAMSMLQSITEPSAALVMGKVHLYKGRDGVGYASVRAEAVRRVEPAEIQTEFAEAAEQTLDRIDLVHRLQASPTISDPELTSDGYPGHWIRAARDALVRYPTVDRSPFREGISRALASNGSLSWPATPVLVPSTVVLTRAPPVSSAAPAPRSAAERAEESAFLDIVDELAESSGDGYAELREVLERLQRRGVAAARAEAIVNRLEEEGTIVEPIVGRLRRSDSDV